MMVGGYMAMFTAPLPVISLLGLLGLTFAIGGVYIYRRHTKSLSRYQTVNLVVVANHRGPDSDGPTFRPEFEVADGEFKGKRRLGTIWSYPPIHSVGDRTFGYLDPSTGRIESAGYSRALRLMAIGLSGAGLSLIGAAAYFALKQEMKL